MPITPLPSVPTRQDPTNFAQRADDFLGALPTFATEANALQADVNAKQVSAANSAAAAAASELAANIASNVSVWVSGTTYSIGDVRYSPITFLSYRRKTAGAGTTDPSADSTNWQVLSGQGDVTLTGVQTISNKTITNSSIAGSQITGTVAITNGGTGATTAANAFNAIKQAATESATGVVELATTAEAQAGTDTTRVITPARLRDSLNATGTAPIYACRAWVNFNGTGTVAIRASGNVSSITDNGTGDYTVNFTTAMPDANYSTQITNGSSSGYVASTLFAAAAPQAVGAVRVACIGFNSVLVDREFVSVAIFR